MKTKFKFLVLLPFFALLLFTSCQEETVEISSPDEAETLTATSELTSFISATSKNDGSKDNIIDGTSCISVKLPVVVKVRGLEIRIDSEADYIKIKRLYEEFEDDIDRLDIIFPITIVTSEHEEITIESAEELSEFIAECKDDDEEEEKEIRCIDFKFPISFSVFDRDFQMIEVVEIENNRQLHRFMKRVKKSEVFASLNFPVNMVLKDGTVLTAENNEQLKRIIEAAKDSCEEEDDFSKERLENYLKRCPWIVYEFKRNNQENDEFKQYAINFKDDGVVTMRSRNGDVLTGEWGLRRTRRGVLLKMAFDNLADFTLEWLLYDFEDGKIKVYEAGGNRIILKRNCEVVVDITKERVKNFLQECLWRITELEVDDINKEDQYIGTPLKFFENNVVKIRINGELVEGTYEVLVRNAGIGLEINLEGRPELKLQWLIKFLSEDEIELINGDNEMELERDCPDNDEDVVYIGEVLVNGVWEVASYMVLDADLTQNYEGYVIGFNANGKLFAEGQGNNYVGSWHGYRYEGINLGLNFRTDDAPFFELRHRWKIKEITPNRIELKDYDSNGEIERVLVLENIQ
ncbi:hypothetical protein EYD45_13480 [Hyunsoonleella flava]|uniref:Uncharacterized protein n=1 Tax=Hyunsoonleella flava TaxID=2527939 RepID=A0A4Q9FCJ5_9FLAO|nr:hypothetical protein [Hyunsoonleella flava]TBN01410.1 hypothetical protein EYD45_13480 [Hyunsoonleella flava]